ncbi:MAG: hypothetical protein RMX65_022340 [Nostoc sp. DedQUE01]|nr:hypothetical protein [Nostoc sp. DedQUE01]
MPLRCQQLAKNSDRCKVDKADNHKYDVIYAKFKSIKITLVNQDFQINIMEQSHLPQRWDADQEFEEALEQLEDILQESPTEDEDTPKLHTDSANELELAQDLTDIDLAAFEDAVADIEQYFEQKTK